MAFKTKLVSVFKVKVDGKPSVSYRRFDTKAGKAKPKLIIGVPGALLSKFKSKDGDRFSLMIGDGADAGKAMIVKDKDGLAGGRKFGLGEGCWTFRFGFVPMLGSAAAEKETVDLVAESADSIIITMPPWFKAV